MNSVIFEDVVDSVSVVGAVPPALANRFQQIAPPRLPTLSRLPRPGERDPITGCSRSWLIETNAHLPAPDRFIFRVKQQGKMRGTVFCNVAKLLHFLQKAEAEDITEPVVA